MSGATIPALERYLEGLDDVQAHRVSMAIDGFLMDNGAISDVLAERVDQVFRHGFTREHDATHPPSDLPLAALTYLEDAIAKLGGAGQAGPVDGLAPEVPAAWPWRDFFRPADARTNLVKAAAFLLAAIDRLDDARPHDASCGAPA